MKKLNDAADRAEDTHHHITGCDDLFRIFRSRIKRKL